MIDNTTTTLAALKALVESGQPVQIWRDKGNGATAAFCRNGIVYRTTWFEQYQEFYVELQGLKGEFSTALALPVTQAWQIAPLADLAA